MISTFNIHTLNTINQLPELVSSAIELNINVIFIQKHCYFHLDVKLQYYSVEKGLVLISASVWKNSLGATIGSVGMFLSPLAYKALLSIEEIEPRVIIVSFNGNTITTIIFCYPSSNEEEVAHLYQYLSCQTSSKPLPDFISGDRLVSVTYTNLHIICPTREMGSFSKTLYRKIILYASPPNFRRKAKDIHLCQ